MNVVMTASNDRPVKTRALSCRTSPAHLPGGAIRSPGGKNFKFRVLFLNHRELPTRQKQRNLLKFNYLTN